MKIKNSINRFVQTARGLIEYIVFVPRSHRSKTSRHAATRIRATSPKRTPAKVRGLALSAAR